ncbi:MAG: DUF58 domain-containing protein [Gemmatimonadales bacterium]|nr:MAG: DUF58 domain-containing protein [Gemmatimonadales bacterium]
MRAPGLSLLPTPRLAGLVLLAGAGFVASPMAGAAANALLAVVLVVEAVRLLRIPTPRVERRVPGRIDLGGRGTVELSLEGLPGLAVRWIDDPGPGIARRPDEPRRVVLPPSGFAEDQVEIEGLRRGHSWMGTIHLRLEGPMGLLLHRRQLAASEAERDPVSVQPGLRALARQRMPGLRHLRAPGAHRLRHQMGGREFARLREYVRGDDPRTVDWKATARRGDVIVREYEAERSQNLMLVLDAGRLMTEAFEGRERLDEALAAALVLADTARTRGDQVGVLLVADTVQAFLPPGHHSMSRIADVLASVEARRVEPDYPRAFALLGRRLKRRSLVVVFTDVVDPKTSRTLLAHLGSSARRHLPLVVAMRNVAMEAVAAAPARGLDGVYRRVAARELLEERAVALAAIRRQGVLVADVRPGDAVAEALARYSEVKRRGLL